MSDGHFWYGSERGYLWSTIGASKHHTGSNSPSAQYAAFYLQAVNPSAGPTLRYLGFPLRGPFNYSLSTNPLYFVRSGFMAIGTVRLWNIGYDSYSWSSMTSSKHHSGSSALSAYYLGFNNLNAGTSNGPYDRWAAFPLSCLND